MLYTKCQVSFCDTTTFKRSPLATRGTWLQLCILCAKEENGGEILKAGGWDDTTWIMACGLRRKDINAARDVGLVSWRGDTLVVHGYDKTGEDRCRFNRTVGPKGGRPKKQNPDDNPDNNPNKNPDDNPGNNRSVIPNETQSKPDQTNPSQPPAVDEPDDPRLIAAAAAGAYLDFKDQDLRPEWLIAIGEDTVGQVDAVMRFGRQKTSKPVRMPSAYVDHRQAIRDLHKTEAQRQRDQAEAEQRRAQERAEKSAQTKQAEASAREWRAVAGGILAVYDEDPARWVDALTEPQAAAIAQLRAAYDANKPLGLLVVRYQDSLPAELITQGRARGRELAETSEGATA